MIRPIILQLSGGALIATSALVAGAPALAASKQTAPKWLVYDARAHTATVTLIAGYSDDASGFNFNGYSKGKMVVTIPSGYKVTVLFSNKAPLPHSAELVPYSQRGATANFKVVFPGAYSPNPNVGLTAGKIQKFAFITRSVGTYALICAVPGHAVAGMWDTFKVVAKGSPSIQTTS